MTTFIFWYSFHNICGIYVTYICKCIEKFGNNNNKIGSFCMCVLYMCVIIQYIFSNLLLVFNRICFFPLVFHQTKYISLSAHTNLSHHFHDCLVKMCLVPIVGHSRLLPNFSVLDNATLSCTYLLQRCQDSCGIDSQLLSQKRWLCYLQTNTACYRMYLSIWRKCNSEEKYWVWKKILRTNLYRGWLHSSFIRRRSLCCRFNSGK